MQCDTDNADQTVNFDLIVRCPSLPQNTFEILESYFGVTTKRKYDWRSENACGKYNEITIEVPKK